MSTDLYPPSDLIRGLISDDQSRIFRVDASTGALIAVDYEHHETHSGSHYVLRINKDVPNAGTYNLAFTTPDTLKWINMVFGITVELEADVVLYEDITSFAGGAAQTPINNNRNSANVSGIVDMETDTTPVLGTPLVLAHLVLGSGRNTGGEARGASEFILKQNTTYLVAMTNQATGASNEVNFFFTWYEHTDRD
jgi:hypothetical protein